MHITFPGMFGQIIKYASAYAVPIFFMIAGYYIYRKGTEEVKRRLLKIIKIFFYAYILFFAFKLTLAIKEHEVGLWFATNFNWKTPVKYIVFCTIDFAIPLWYLIAMIETYVIWLFVVKYKKEDKVVKIFPLLFILQILLTSYCETMQLQWFWKMNFITRAMPWFLLGYYMHTEEFEKIQDLESYKLIIISVIGCIIAIIPTLLNLSFKFNVIGYIPYAFGLFTLTLKNSSTSVCKIIEYIGKNLSLYIYIFHIIIDGIISFIINNILKINDSIYLWCRPVVILFCTIIVSYIFYYIMNKIKERKMLKQN